MLLGAHVPRRLKVGGPKLPVLANWCTHRTLPLVSSFSTNTSSTPVEVSVKLPRWIVPRKLPATYEFPALSTAMTSAESATELPRKRPCTTCFHSGTPSGEYLATTPSVSPG